MKWQGRQRSSNIEDRRGQRTAPRGGGLGGLGGGSSPFGRNGGFRIPTGRRSGGGIGGIGVIVVIGIILFSMGINPLELLSGGTQTSSRPSAASQLPPREAGTDELGDFVGVVIKETEDLWGQVFAANDLSYDAPRVVLFTGQTNSGCGMADAATGPFYCPQDQKVYIDLSFYDELRHRFGAPGDFAQAYVLAHEVGHHVQNLTGVLPEFNQRRRRMSQADANAYSVRIELQADCYAGIWANYVGEENLLDDGDIEEAITAADAIGDDRLQKQMQGFAVPKTFTHGTSAQRKIWFQRGYTSGDVSQCDTFSGNI